MHGLWQGHSRRGAAVARAAKVPYVMAAHGMAEPWALRHKRWKKKLYLALVEARNLRRASCLHALSRPEIGHLRSLAPWAPVCFVPNGVDLEAFDDMPPREALEAEHPELKDKFVLLFYGRVHAKKGLDLLAEVVRTARRHVPASPGTRPAPPRGPSRRRGSPAGTRGSAPDHRSPGSRARTARPGAPRRRRRAGRRSAGSSRGRAWRPPPRRRRRALRARSRSRWRARAPARRSSGHPRCRAPPGGRSGRAAPAPRRAAHRPPVAPRTGGAGRRAASRSRRRCGGAGRRGWPRRRRRSRRPR